MSYNPVPNVDVGNSFLQNVENQNSATVSGAKHTDTNVLCAL